MFFKPIALVACIATTLLASASGNRLQPGSDSGSAEGHAVILTKHIDGGRETHFVVLLDEAHESLVPDGRTDRTFRLQALGGSLDDLDLSFPTARVEWSSGTVSVSGPTGRTVELTIHEGASSLSPSVQSVTGYGLSHTVGWDFPLPDETFSDAEYFEVFGSMDSSDCDSGGPLATGCSIGCGPGLSCGVDCAELSYACCNCNETGPPSCECVPFPIPN